MIGTPQGSTWCPTQHVKEILTYLHNLAVVHTTRGWCAQGRPTPLNRVHHLINLLAHTCKVKMQYWEANPLSPAFGPGDRTIYMIIFNVIKPTLNLYS